mgnify:CR=1 FL=1|tara:strand:- start:47 stop:976 length:930 start_codon:yes stop_codon:yes gene_type:complete
MALTKVNRGGLNTGISDSSDATAITIDSSENITTGGGVTVTGDIDIANKLIHTGDDNTHIAFTTDQVNITAGNENTIQCNYNNVVINEDGADINFRVEGDSLTNLFVCDAGQEAIAMGDANPTRHSKATRLLCYNGSGTGTDFALHVGRVGTGAESQVCFSNGYGEVGSIKTNGTSTSFNTSSDYRLKESITYDFDATTRLKQLKPCRFNFKTDADKTVDGFLAHEVSSIVPEAINGEKDATQDIGTVKDADGNVALENVPESRKKNGQTWTKTGTENLYQDIDQSKLVPLLVKTVQELEARIKILESA